MATVRPFIFRQSLLSASLLKSMVDINADGIAEVPAQTVAAPAQGFAAPRAVLPTPQQMAADPTPQPQAQSALDQEFLAKATAWSNYAMTQLSQIGGAGRAYGHQDLVAVNGVMQQAAYHLHSLAQEAQERGAPETLKFITDTLDNLGKASQIYAEIPGSRNENTMKAMMYQRQTMLDQQNQDMQANMRNVMRVAGILNPEMQQQGSFMPPFGMPGMPMGMPGMGMPGMPMGMPGMPMGMGMPGMPMNGMYPNMMYGNSMYPTSMFGNSMPMMGGYPSMMYPTPPPPPPPDSK